jgi:hypothetical protein
MDRVLVAGNTAPNGSGGGIEFAAGAPYLMAISNSTIAKTALATRVAGSTSRARMERRSC